MEFATLPSKPDAPLAYRLLRSKQDKVPLVVFINGLGLPSISWNPTISLLHRESNILTYDRYGQGSTTSRDPLDEQPGKEPGFGHDLNDSVNDLHELLTVVAKDLLILSPLVFVAASIGVHIARLYTAKHPHTVAGLLFLDSNIGNKEFTDFWPNPDDPNFDKEDILSKDCTLDQYTAAYSKLKTMFNSDVRNPEGLDRRNVKLLLPDPSQPELLGVNGRSPELVVVGHDPETFALENLDKLKIPLSITKKYTQPAWHEYNERLLKLSDSSIGVLFAPDASHFIQKDNPVFVAKELESLLERIEAAPEPGL